MLGLHYHSYQYYSYIDLEKLKQILEWDSIGQVNLYEDEKTIKYKIDRSKHVRLSDLIELIEIGFIRFHLGQLLLLFIELLKKVKLMEDQYLAHNYLREDRIWLNLKNETYLSITYQKIQYSISFTGYQSKFYDDLTLKEIADQQKILQIISCIITKLKKKKYILNKNGNSKDEIIDKIYEPILNLCQKGQIGDKINYINILQEKYSYNSNDQTVSFDDRLIDGLMYSKRKHQKKIIEQQLQQLIEKLDLIPVVTEQFLFEKIKEIRLNLKEWGSLELNENTETLKYHEMLQNYKNKKNQIQQTAISLITDMIENIVKKKDLIQSLRKVWNKKKDLIINNLLGFKLFNYFENTKEICQNFAQDYYIKFILDLGLPFIEESIDNYIQSQILILINELI